MCRGRGFIFFLTYLHLCISCTSILVQLIQHYKEDSTEKVITVKQVTKQYGQFKALDDVSLSIYENDIYGLIGQNGAGKTTLFKTLLSLTQLNSGSMDIKNRQNIGFYIGASFYPYLNAFDNIEYYRIQMGIKEKQETMRVLQLVGLNEETKPFKAYSMSMKERLEIASALLGNPKILILDKPTNGIDPQGIREIRELIVKLNQDLNMTILISSHILSELEHVVNRYAIIHQGKIIQEVNQSDVKKSALNTIYVVTDKIDKTMEILKGKIHSLTPTKHELGLLIPLMEHQSYEIANIIVQHGIQLHEMRYVNETMEDVYFKLTKGAIHVTTY